MFDDISKDELCNNLPNPFRHYMVNYIDRAKNKEWTTKDEKVIKIKDMTTEHIINAITLLYECNIYNEEYTELQKNNLADELYGRDLTERQREKILEITLGEEKPDMILRIDQDDN